MQPETVSPEAHARPVHRGFEKLGGLKGASSNCTPLPARRYSLSISRADGI